jgi:hypothetical protein
MKNNRAMLHIDVILLERETTFSFTALLSALSALSGKGVHTS